jgi:AcrR family transcriptional regulator
MTPGADGGAPTDTREEIVRAVMRALAKHGYAALTTKKVAAEASVSEAGLYYHYDSKDDLVVAFLEWALERDSARLSAAVGEDPVTRLYAVCDALLGDPEDDVDRGINVAMMELLAHAPHEERFADLLESYEWRVVDTVAAILEDGIEAGVFRSDLDAGATAAYVLVTTDGTAGAVMALGMTEVGRQVRERLFAYLDEVVLAPGVSPPPAYR